MEQQVREGKVLVDPLKSCAYRAGKWQNVSQNAMVAMPASFWAKPLAFELGNGLGLL
jgi:hypothetical protein